MKKVTSAFVVIIIVSTALALKPLGQGQIYCDSACTQATRIDWRLDPTNQSEITDPCENGQCKEYILISDTCVELCNKRYIQTPI